MLFWDGVLIPKSEQGCVLMVLWLEEMFVLCGTVHGEAGLATAVLPLASSRACPNATRSIWKSVLILAPFDPISALAVGSGS